MDIFKRVVSEIIPVRLGETSSRITRAEAVIRANYQKVLKSGDQRATHNILSLAERAGLFRNNSDLNEVGGFMLVPRTLSEEELVAKHGGKKEA